MLVKPNFSQQRKQKLYQRELSHILYKIAQNNDFPVFSLSYCILSTRGENLKVYLNFSCPEKKQKELLKTINNKYSLLVKKEIAKSKKFSYIPTLFFLLDGEMEKVNNLEKFAQKLNINHND